MNTIISKPFNDFLGKRVLIWFYSSLCGYPNKGMLSSILLDYCCLRLQQPIKLRHRTRLDGVHDVDVGLHGLVIGVASPFHHYVRGDAQEQGVDD